MSSQFPEAPLESHKGLRLVEAFRIILLRKIFVFACALTAAIVAAILVPLLKPTYTASATFLPPNSLSSGSSLLLGQLGALSGSGGMLGAIKDPGMIYVGILGSRTVADDLIQQFDLRKVYKTQKLSVTERILAAHTKFIPGKDSLVTISVEDHDAQRAADMANGYLKALSAENDRLALTEAGQRRVFFQRQLEKEKNLLADAEVELTRTQVRTGIIRPNGQAEVEINSIAQTRADISSREIELTALSQGATDQNPDVIRLRSEISTLRDQLSRLENSSAKGGPGDVMAPASQVPELTLEYVRREREVRYHDDLYALLLRQYESARLDEARSAPLMQIVDPAVVPDSKSGPYRTLLVLLAAFAGGVFGIVWVTLPALWEKTMQSPANAAAWKSLQQAARFRRPVV